MLFVQFCDTALNIVDSIKGDDELEISNSRTIQEDLMPFFTLQRLQHA